MLVMEPNHFELVKESLSGRREIDEHTFASLEVLRERMERLKQLDKSFSRIGFSPFVRRLARQHKEVAVG
jgi:hypothetical protein